MGQADAGVTYLNAFPWTGGANPHLLCFLSRKDRAIQEIQRLTVYADLGIYL